MTKADLITQISENTGIGRATVRNTVEAFMVTIKKSLENGENVYLRNFGTFVVKKRATKLGRNISKNTAVVIPARYIPSFKPSETFVSLVKNNNAIS
jgi:DNA-binding protein HU-beta